MNIAKTVINESYRNANYCVPAVSINTQRMNNAIVQSVKHLAVARVAMSYHDGQVNCRVIENSRLNRKFFVTGQIARCVKTGKFVSFRDVFN